MIEIVRLLQKKKYIYINFAYKINLIKRNVKIAQIDYLFAMTKIVASFVK